MPRLFIAIDVAPEVRRQLEGLRRPISGARWTPPEQLHLTLRFLGDVPDEQVLPLRVALRGISSTPFSIALEGVGQFPKNRPAHVLWAGLAAPEALAELARSIEAVVTGLGLPPADKPFSPHITIARLKDARKGDVTRFLESHAAIASEPFPVPGFTLYASTLSPKGATHTVVETFPLA